MVLVDTSVWVDHLRAGDTSLAMLLQANRVRIHSMILGELACGHLQNRQEVLGLLRQLPHAVEASHAEVMHAIEHHRLMGMGIGFVDAHLLAACMLTGNTRLWTRDKRLSSLAQSLGIGYFAVN